MDEFSSGAEIFKNVRMADGFIRRAGSHGSTAGRDARRYGAMRRGGDGGEGSLVAPTCLAEVGRRRK